jgi:hypothetical protein
LRAEFIFSTPKEKKKNTWSKNEKQKQNMIGKMINNTW